jgi:hypothetical protein
MDFCELVEFLEIIPLRFTRKGESQKEGMFLKIYLRGAQVSKVGIRISNSILGMGLR